MIKTLLAAIVAASALSLAPESGLKVGDNVSPFHPQHVTGPNKGTDACPP